jgi:hypothetical protein
MQLNQMLGFGKKITDLFFMKIKRMIVQITSRVPKSHSGCQNHTHDVKITLMRVV